MRQLFWSLSVLGRHSVPFISRFRVNGGVLVGSSVLLLLALKLTPAQAQEPDPIADARRFIAMHETVVRPLETAQGAREWDADVTGTDETFKAKEAAVDRLNEALSNPARFAALKAIRQALRGNTQESEQTLRRQIEVLYFQYLPKQLDPALLKRINAKEVAIGKAFNVYRAKVDGKELADSEVREVLKSSKDVRQRKAVWEASKAVGSAVERDLKELIGLRNEAARKVGFKDFHALSLYSNEQSQEDVLKLFDELATLTRASFKASKERLDTQLAKTYGIPSGDLRPWHYQDPFFQEAPARDTRAITEIYRQADILKLCRQFYASVGLPVDAILARSDLFEKPGKYPHARCADIDREGDVRVMANIVPNEYWMGTMLHELGHAVYASSYIPRDVPYVLRGPAHALTTEGIAMMFEKGALDTTWMESMGLTVSNRESVSKAALEAGRNHLLIFAAWAQVMFRFEMAMYEDPNHDLNTLWWELVEKYQMIHRPEGRNAPDYAAKIHIAQYPAYYHNYLMGELFAAQVHQTIMKDVLHTSGGVGEYVGHKEVGEFLKRKIFVPAALLKWNELTRLATGQELNAKAFAQALK